VFERLKASQEGLSSMVLVITVSHIRLHRIDIEVAPNCKAKRLIQNVRDLNKVLITALPAKVMLFGLNPVRLRS
jgi:hypothetical protein